MSEANPNPEESTWSEALPEFARDWNEVKQSDSMESFLNRIGEQRSFLGSAIRIPSDDASQEDIDSFDQKLLDKVPSLMKTPDLENPDSLNMVLKKLGKPDEASGYGDVEGEDVHFDEGQLDELKNIAHELGLTKKQFSKFVEKVGKENFETRSLEGEYTAGEVKRIQEEWGLAAEAKYQATLNFAKQAGAPEQLVDALVNKQIDADTVFWLNSMAAKIGEDGKASFEPNNSTGSVLTPAEAQERINEILSNPNHGYHKGDPASRAKMHEYMKLANPDRKYA